MPHSIFKQRLPSLAASTIGLLSLVGAVSGNLDPKIYSHNGSLIQADQVQTYTIAKVENGKGSIKVLLSLLAIGLFGYSLYLAQIAEENEIKINQLKALEHIKHQQKLELEALAHSESLQIMHENRVRGYLAEQLGVPVSELAQQALQTVDVQQETPPQQQSIAPSMTVERQPQQQQLQATNYIPSLPSDMRLIQAKELENIDEYPNILIVAAKGEGKTLTVKYLMSCLQGTLVFGSHKATAKDEEFYDLVFGYNYKTNKSCWEGDPLTYDKGHHRDFAHHLKIKEDRSMIDFVHGMFREWKNRAANGEDYWNSQGTMRVFFDESSVAYTSLFLDPEDQKQETLKAAQNLISATNKSLLMDGRSQLMQIFLAAQSDSVKSVGLENMSEARDETWFLYPAKRAVSKALEMKRPDLAHWLQQRIDAGYSVAFMVKNGVHFRVINMPKLADLKQLE